jgi:hypothetical protein
VLAGVAPQLDPLSFERPGSVGQPHAPNIPGLAEVRYARITAILGSETPNTPSALRFRALLTEGTAEWFQLLRA